MFLGLVQTSTLPKLQLSTGRPPLPPNRSDDDGDGDDRGPHDRSGDFWKAVKVVGSITSFVLAAGTAGIAIRGFLIPSDAAEEAAAVFSGFLSLPLAGLGLYLIPSKSKK